MGEEVRLRVEEEVENSINTGVFLRPKWLRCSVQNYDWGKKGEESTVANLYGMNSKLGPEEVDAAGPYAEFWMGTHESGPSFLVGPKGDGSAVKLKDWIGDNPNAVGSKVVENWGCDLPFLFKVLSVSKALSIQAHPDKQLAAILHAKQPGVYKDANHKPEMAIAITQFNALCGFISLKELKDVFRSVPEIAELVGSEDKDMILAISEDDEIDGDKIKGSLSSIFTRFMAAKSDIISELICRMKSRLSSEDKLRVLTDKERLALELEEQYPDDVGVISSFFFNYVKLNPGEALYIGPNEPHAYLFGECIECMATSDNVVRAGLTPKFRDVPTLCSMLTYKQGFPEILKGIRLNEFTLRYTPPFDEFEVDCCFLPPRESVNFQPVLGPSLFVVLKGDGDVQFGFSKEKDAILEGDVLFVPENIGVTLFAGSSELKVYRAGINESFFQ